MNNFLFVICTPIINKSKDLLNNENNGDAYDESNEYYIANNRFSDPFRKMNKNSDLFQYLVYIADI